MISNDMFESTFWYLGIFLLQTVSRANTPIDYVMTFGQVHGNHTISRLGITNLITKKQVMLPTIKTGIYGEIALNEYKLTVD